MTYNHGREDRKWRIWKEAEEKVQREKSNESKRRSRARKRQVCIELSAKNDRLMLDSAEGRQTNKNKKGTSSILKRL